MQNHLEQAKNLLMQENLTCVVFDGIHTYRSTQRGIAPLMAWLADGIEMRDFSAADKVVGKAAAYLYVLLGVKAVYAHVISRPALDVLMRYNITVTYGELVPAIRNRNDTGFCPMETAVLGIDDAQKAYAVLESKLAEMRSGGSAHA